MTRITVDDFLSVQLGQVGKTVEIFNTAGVSLGHFVPSFTPPPEDQCPYSAEELAEMHAEKGGRPLAEIWKELGVN